MIAAIDIKVNTRIVVWYDLIYIKIGLRLLHDFASLIK